MATYSIRERLKPDGTRWRSGGEVKGKLANGVGSQYSHTTSEHGVSSITNADAHTSAASSRLNWRPRWFKWARPFRRKTKSGFCACAIRFQTRYSTLKCCAVMCSCISIREFIIVAVAEHENWESMFRLKCCAVVLPPFTLDSVDRSWNVTAQEHSTFIFILCGLKSIVLIVLSICVSCHLVTVHETVTWECDRTDIPKYESWNFNSGNYLFTTDTK